MIVTDLRRRLGPLAVCLVPALLAAALSTFWLHTGRLGIGGDEPHYLIIAASVTRDGDLNLRNNYRHDIYTKEIFGEFEPHIVRTDAGWMPYHTPGLGALLAAPFEWGGRRASRLALCVLPLLFGLACTRWLPRALSRATVLWLTAGTLLSMPVLFGTSRIYPDLIGGFVAAGLALWLWSEDRQRSLLGWAAFWWVVGLMPWLHVKYVAAVLVFGTAGALQGWHETRRGERSTRAHLLAASTLWVGLGGLAVFNAYAFGSLLGGRSAAELSIDPFRVLELLLGLHLDQAQGMLFQHPLLLVAGLVSLGALARARDRVVLPWLFLYAALILPNAMQLARYGGGGPAGRFGWSAVWLWLVPIALVLTRHRDALERYARPAVIASLAYQALIAIRWIPAPDLLFPVLSESLAERNSLFPVALRSFVPSFYFWDYRTYLVYLPNVGWTVAASLLIALGALSFPGLRARDPRR